MRAALLLLLVAGCSSSSSSGTSDVAIAPDLALAACRLAATGDATLSPRGRVRFVAF